LAENVEFTEGDMELIENVNKVKKHLISYYSKEDLVDTIKELIDNSDNIKFKNKRAKKFININTPVFMITVKDIDEDDFRKEDKLIQFMSNTIYDEIIDKFSDYFIEEDYPEEFVTDNPELLQEDGTLRDITKIIISSIFSMRFEVKTHSVYLEYFI
jgi:Na+-transporting NADH:ubiquinone oxidoreductase subunit NqrF